VRTAGDFEIVTAQGKAELFVVAVALDVQVLLRNLGGDHREHLRRHAAIDAEAIALFARGAERFFESWNVIRDLDDRACAFLRETGAFEIDR
jgi:hypothetical protein